MSQMGSKKFSDLIILKKTCRHRRRSLPAILPAANEEEAGRSRSNRRGSYIDGANSKL